MNRKITTSIFGMYDPYILDPDWTLRFMYMKYTSSEAYRILKEEEMKYLIEKWYFLRKFFSAESLGDDILKINDGIRLKHIQQKRREYFEVHREQINKRRGEKVTCECGAIIRNDYISVHRKSYKHTWLKNNL